MQLKANVKFSNPISAMSIAAIVVNDVYAKHGIECVITSYNDSKHSVNSLHYKDCAFDVRTKNIPSPELKTLILNEIIASLTSDFDVILEGLGTVNEHLHLEYDVQ